MSEKHCTPQSLQYMALKLCCIDRNAHARITKIEFSSAVVSNFSGTLAVQLSDRRSLRLTALQYVQEECNK